MPVTFRSIAAAATLALLIASPSQAQDFPEGSAVPAATDLKQRLAGKVFDVKLANGSSWRLDFRSSGYFYIDLSNGFKDTGEWDTEEGRLCTKPRKIPAACNLMRTRDDTLFMRRDNGELVQLVARP